MIRTIRNYEKYYLEAGLDRLLTFDYKGGFSRLTPEQESKLKEHVSTHHYQDSKALINYVKGHFEVKYSSTGIVDLLHRLGFTYKKPKIIPGKADAEKQLEYLENKLRPLLDKASDASPLSYFRHPCNRFFRNLFFLHFSQAFTVFLPWLFLLFASSIDASIHSSLNAINSL